MSQKSRQDTQSHALLFVLFIVLCNMPFLAMLFGRRVVAIVAACVALVTAVVWTRAYPETPRQGLSNGMYVLLAEVILWLLAFAFYMMATRY